MLLLPIPTLATSLITFPVLILAACFGSSGIFITGFFLTSFPTRLSSGLAKILLSPLSCFFFFLIPALCLVFLAFPAANSGIIFFSFFNWFISMSSLALISFVFNIFSLSRFFLVSSFFASRLFIF